MFVDVIGDALTSIEIQKPIWFYFIFFKWPSYFLPNLAICHHQKKIIVSNRLQILYIAKFFYNFYLLLLLLNLLITLNFKSWHQLPIPPYSTKGENIICIRCMFPLSHMEMEGRNMHLIHGNTTSFQSKFSFEL